MASLIELGEKYGTDKVQLGYLEHYQDLFESIRNNWVRLLEIGVWHGASLRMWRDYFPVGLIYGIDKRPEYQVEGEDRITTFFGRQQDETFLCEVIEKTQPFDIIIDDASHRGQYQLESWQVLWHRVKPGGWYIIEDCNNIFNPVITRLGSPTILNALTNDFQGILTGQSLIQELRMLSKGQDGLICMKKRETLESPSTTSAT